MTSEQLLAIMAAIIASGSTAMSYAHPKDMVDLAYKLMQAAREKLK